MNTEYTDSGNALFLARTFHHDGKINPVEGGVCSAPLHTAFPPPIIIFTITYKVAV
jgi:hypothetical protein